ncbi:MAG: zinc-ribbon domain-containing protein [Muribaculaceae bacterium]|nr:zinc-ribbon domain-containing protein [Muribaculaceae bacterium]
MFCKNCGNQISDNAAFCPKCGTQVTVKAPVMQDKAVQQPKKKSGFMILAVALVAVVGIIAGAATFFYKGKDQTPEELTETSTQQTEEISEPVQEGDGQEPDIQSEEVTEGNSPEAGNAATDETALEDDAYAVFGITQGIAEDYASNLDTHAYQYYNSGIADFSFFYPANLYGEVRYSDEKTESVSGTNIETIDFTGSEGSELRFSLSQYQGASIEDMTETVYLARIESMEDAADIIHHVYEDHGRIIVTGFRDNGSKMVYDLMKVDNEYVMQMQIIFPAYRGNEDKFQKDYVTECLYRLCGFSGSTLTCRSYEKYKEESIDLEAEIE